MNSAHGMPPHDDSDAALVQLLRGLLDAQPSADQVHRLTQFWQRQSLAERRQRYRRRVVAFSAVAAAVMIALTAMTVLVRSLRPGDPPPAGNQTPLAGAAPRSEQVGRSTPPQRERRDDSTSLAQATPLRDAPKRDYVRPSTDYERLVLLARTQLRHPSQRVAKTDAGRHIGLADLRQWRQQAEAAASRVPPLVEQLLLHQLATAETFDQQRLSICLLGFCGSSKSVDTLLELAEQPDLRPLALQSIEQLVGPSGLVDAINRCPHRDVRLAGYRQLLVTPRGLDAYLTLVGNHRFRKEVLQAAEPLPAVSLAQLLDLIDADNKQQRQAAALVLSHASGRDVTDALVAHVSQQSGRYSEAWIALMTRRDPRVDEFFAYVSTDPRLLGRLNRARADWARTIY